MKKLKKIKNHLPWRENRVVKYFYYSRRLDIFVYSPFKAENWVFYEKNGEKVFANEFFREKYGGMI